DAAALATAPQREHASRREGERREGRREQRPPKGGTPRAPKAAPREAKDAAREAHHPPAESALETEAVATTEALSSTQATDAAHEAAHRPGNGAHASNGDEHREGSRRRRGRRGRGGDRARRPGEGEAPAGDAIGPLHEHAEAGAAAPVDVDEPLTASAHGAVHDEPASVAANVEAHEAGTMARPAPFAGPAPAETIRVESPVAAAQMPEPVVEAAVTPVEVHVEPASSDDRANDVTSPAAHVAVPAIDPIALAADSGLVLVETRSAAVAPDEHVEPARPRRVRPPRVQIADEPLQLVETRKHDGA
ncbi:MAG TPA: hypothetical protein VFQ93_09415, partial [Casimicrobiaceae bacterium]|nr:hypothetical protein [Casimicrobiaceae bacterium]